MSGNDHLPNTMLHWRWLFGILALCNCAWSAWGQSVQRATRVIEILADHDSRYKIEGQKQPVITVEAGEAVTLRITAKKAKNVNRDGAIHGFTLLRAKDRSPVDEWDFMLKPGVQEFSVTAPTEPGEYLVLCTVICSQDHEGMNMKLVVLP
jgi:heme/copper-type cytochrome/quinol oxidase subunit 2